MPQAVRDMSESQEWRGTRQALRMRRYRFLGDDAQISGNDADSLDLIDSLVRAFRDDSSAGPPAMRFSVIREDKPGGTPRYLTVDPGFHTFVCEDVSQVVSFWGAQLMRNHLYRTGYLLLHAAALEREGGVWVFMGSAGCGKTTLALRLAAGGWGFFSDEVAPIDTATGLLHPFPRSLLVRDARLELPGRTAAGMPAAARVFLDYQERMPDGTPARRWMVPPDALDFEVRRDPAPPRVFCFIDGFSPDAMSAEPLSAAAALQMLLDHAMNSGYIERGDPAGCIARLVRLLERVPAVRLRLGPADETPAELGDALHGAVDRCAPTDLDALRQVAHVCRARMEGATRARQV